MRLVVLAVSVVRAATAAMVVRARPVLRARRASWPAELVAPAVAVRPAATAAMVVPAGQRWVAPSTASMAMAEPAARLGLVAPVVRAETATSEHPVPVRGRVVKPVAMPGQVLRAVTAVTVESVVRQAD